ncbi:MAG: hypothetical protein ABI456_16745 [Ktedonobacteraceae bacterium]|nr:hypothetical protein [Chloroflexota bacterium]
MQELISQIHYYNMFLVLASGAIAGIWGLILYITKRTETMNQPWRISLIVAALIGALQGVLGVLLVILGQKPGTGTGLYWLHYVYGGIVALVLPVAVTYATSGKNVRRDVLIFSIGAFILVAAAVRALMTGPH